VKLGLVEYSAGNIASLERAFIRLGAHPFRARTGEEIAAADALVLPGVGHFGALMSELKRSGFEAPLREAIASGKPFLGICVGMQMLFAGSDEAPEALGLGVFPGTVARLPHSVKLPHMGWNQLHHEGTSRLLAGMPAGAYVYFAHSYAALASNGAAVATCKYGVNWVAAVEHSNVFGVQFHPEKSGEAGATVLRNFLMIAEQPAAEAV